MASTSCGTVSRAPHAGGPFEPGLDLLLHAGQRGLAEQQAAHLGWRSPRQPHWCSASGAGAAWRPPRNSSPWLLELMVARNAARIAAPLSCSAAI
jgi:hypothetical protein